MFRRFFDEGLAQSSYLLACERTRLAAIIDPRRDVDLYVEVAAAHGLRIVLAIETHTHADFASGASGLAGPGVTVVSGPGAGLGIPHEEAADGSVRQLGDVELTFLHTPGHTPEHISVVAREPGAPDRVFTGDTLFVGAVGRPDLLGASEMRGLAADLYDSLFAKLLALPDHVEVHPGHGAGSLCGAGIRSDPSSTIGRERSENPFLGHTDKAAFVAAVLGDLPETPPYFARMKRLNREGPPALDLIHGVKAPQAMTAEEAEEAVRAGAWLLDLRPIDAYAVGHPAGALGMPFGPKVGYWAGWILPADARVVLMCDADPRHAIEARRQLLLVGQDHVEGMVDGGFAAWRIAGLPVRQVAQIPAVEIRSRPLSPETLMVLDVRSDREWEASHLPGALHIPLGELEGRAAEVPRAQTVATLCEGGYRAGLAAGLLERAGLTNIAIVQGGMRAVRGLEAAVS